MYRCVYRESFGYDWKSIWLVYDRRRQVQLVALLVAVVIHMYMNVAQLRKTKRYFK